MPKFTTEQLEAIQESGQNIIVSAGAGSGNFNIYKCGGSWNER